MEHWTWGVEAPEAPEAPLSEPEEEPRAAAPEVQEDEAWRLHVLKRLERELAKMDQTQRRSALRQWQRTYHPDKRPEEGPFLAVGRGILAEQKKFSPSSVLSRWDLKDGTSVDLGLFLEPQLGTQSRHALLKASVEKMMLDSSQPWFEICV